MIGFAQSGKGHALSMALPFSAVKFCPCCGAKLAHGEVFGELRPYCPACGYVHFFDPKVATAVFVTSGDRVLLIRRAVDPERGKWALPAGYVDAREDPREAAKREALEETGLEVRVTRLLNVFHNDSEGGASIVIVYAAEVLGGELRPLDDADAVEWFGPQNLPEMAFESTRQLVTQWAQNHS